MKSFDEFLGHQKANRNVEQVAALVVETNFPIEDFLDWFEQEGQYLPPHLLEEAVQDYVEGKIGRAIGAGLGMAGGALAGGFSRLAGAAAGGYQGAKMSGGNKLAAGAGAAAGALPIGGAIAGGKTGTELGGNAGDWAGDKISAGANYVKDKVGGWFGKTFSGNKDDAAATPAPTTGAKPDPQAGKDDQGISLEKPAAKPAAADKGGPDTLPFPPGGVDAKKAERNKQAATLYKTTVDSINGLRKIASSRQAKVLDDALNLLKNNLAQQQAAASPGVGANPKPSPLGQAAASPGVGANPPPSPLGQAQQNWAQTGEGGGK